MKPIRSWMKRNENYYVHLDNSRGPSVTLVGALDENNGMILYDLVKGSFNKDSFLRFLQALK